MQELNHGKRPFMHSLVSGASNMRCAIYTRKSVDERPDSLLGSVHRQRELCEAYVASQAGEGWTQLGDYYDDEGWSGANLQRPSLARLLAAAERGDVEAIVVYKIDRLSRSLRDFLNLIEKLTHWGVSFIAITQQLDTTTSTGRLMINILLSFAQFERELTSDRLRDWFAGARTRGLWSGRAPYGYRTDKMRLTVVPEEAKIVRWLYRRYSLDNSGFKLAEEMNRKSLLTHRGKPFVGSDVYRILRSRVYLGELPNDGSFIKGSHDSIVDEVDWVRVQALLDRRVWGRGSRSFDRPAFALDGLVFDRHGDKMYTKGSVKRGRVFRYYVPGRIAYGNRYRPGAHFRADDLEDAVVKALKQIGCAPLPSLDPKWLGTALRQMIKRIDFRGEHMDLTLTSGVTLTAPYAGLVTSRPKPRTGQSTKRDDELRKLYLTGLTASRVASRVGMSKSGVLSALRRLGEPRREGAIIAIGRDA